VKRTTVFGRALASAAVAVAAAGATFAAPALASSRSASGNSLRAYHDRTVGSLVAPNGDQNPYGVAVVPLSSGTLVKGDLLVAEFNNKANISGAGTTIVQVDPSSGRTTVFASGLPISGPVGIAINPVNDGVWVGDFGASDGSTSNDLLIAPNGTVKATFDSMTTAKPVSSGQQPSFNGVWGEGVSRTSSQVSFYYGTTGSGLRGTGGGEVWRIDPHPTASTSNGQPVNATYVEVASGLADNATRGMLPVTASNATGPEGFAYDAATGVLYVSDDANNTVYALPGAATATTAVKPRIVLHNGGLDHPENIALDPANGDLLIANAGDNTLLEIDPSSGTILGSRLLQSGASGALFGLAVTPGANGQSDIYYVNDTNNTLHELVPYATAAVMTEPASDITATTAVLNGVIGARTRTTTYQFQYGTTDRLGRATPIRTLAAGRSSVRVSFQIRHLKPGERIHYRLAATSSGTSGAIVYGADMTFETKSSGSLLLTSRTLNVRNGAVYVPLRCASMVPCRGKFSITTRTHVRKSHKLATVLCATTKRFFDIPAGARRTIRAHVRSACMALLHKARGHRLSAKLTSGPRSGQRALIARVTLILR
jgi:DNA-binding beta-propeller fold protein YncE